MRLLEAMDLARPGRVDAGVVLRLVRVARDVAAIVSRLFEEPREDARRRGRMEDARGRASAVHVGHVVAGGDAKVGVSGELVSPALDPGEQSFHARAIAPDTVAVAGLVGRLDRN